MPILVSDLPPRYRAQVLAKAAVKKESKYKNQKCKFRDIEFDSKKEMYRYITLLAMYNEGIIEDLRLQHTFTLQSAYTTPEGERIRAITYKADFTYLADGDFIVEDVKSDITRKKSDYRMKVKMMQDKLGIKVVEV